MKVRPTSDVASGAYLMTLGFTVYSQITIADYGYKTDTQDTEDGGGRGGELKARRKGEDDKKEVNWRRR
jgi:hypothetical protein